MAHAVLLTVLIRTALRAQLRYRAMLAQGSPRRPSPEAYSSDSSMNMVYI